ncbi:MAG: hypothetical protein LBV80_10915 [Deltaproteobacteria bacterium]|jgi:hypothetical protein|nr:hypothetical protein [Deltaproteobacteria bacterium]
MNKNTMTQSRLNFLNRRKVKDARELGAALREMLEVYAAEAQAEINQANLELYDALVERCPKDSGRLAAGFQVSRSSATGASTNILGDASGGASANLSGEASGDASGNYHAALASIRAANRAKIAACKPGECLCIYNNVEYLEEVERGSGAARGGFMALPLREHALRLQRLARSHRH